MIANIVMPRENHDMYMTKPPAASKDKFAIRQMSRHFGFTLIEIMVVVVIVAILASIAYPSYTRFVTDTRRSEGQRLLFLAAAQQEKFFTECGRYASNFGTPLNCTGSVLGVGNTLADVPYYSLRVSPDPATTNNIATSYLLTAVPSGVQLSNDTNCINLTLTSQGIKWQSGPNTGNRCWKK